MNTHKNESTGVVDWHLLWPSAKRSPASLLLIMGSIALAIGAVASVSLAIAGGTLVIALLLTIFAGSRHKNELVVGVYWVAFCVYETVLTGTTISGFFYPFYLYFLIAAVIGFANGGLRLHIPTTLAYMVFMVVVLVSFVGFKQAVSFEVIQRLVAYILGILVAVQFRSFKGLTLGAWGFITGAMVVSVWVIDASVQSDFAYRAGITVNQNDLSAMVALGLLPALSILFHTLVGRRRNFLYILLLMAVSGSMLYAVALLASRGMTLAILMAVTIIGLRIIARRPVTAVAFLALLLGGSSILLLPGGESIVERFSERNVTSANHRAGLWEVTVEEYSAGNFYELLVGFGFDSNKVLLQREIGWTTSTHNAYLQLLYEFGFIGLLLFVALLTSYVLLGWRVSSEMGSIVLGLTVFMIGSNLSSNGPNGFVFWLTFGYVAGAVNLLAGPKESRQVPGVGSRHSRTGVGLDGVGT